MSSRTIVIDAENLILGRMATFIAKRLQEGYRVYVINAEKAVLSGEPKMVIDSYKLLLKVRTYRNPYKLGRKRPRSPIRLVKEAVKGMLPRNWRSKLLLKNLKVYVGKPKELEGLKVEPIKIPDASVERLGKKYIYLGDVAKHLGWRGGS